MFDHSQPESRMDVAIENLRRELTIRGISPRRLSESINEKSPNLVSRFLKGSSITLPSYLAIEDALGLPAGSLLQEKPTVTKQDINALFEEVDKATVRLRLSNGPTIEDFLRAYHECGGNISVENQMLEHMDIYYTPTDSGFYVNPARLGKESPLAKQIGDKSPDEALQTLSQENTGFCEESARDQKRVIDGADIFDERQIDQKFLDGSVLTGRFARVLKRGTWAGAPVVLTFGREV